MNTFIITEKQHLNSTREGTTIELSSLTEAKRWASKNQCFYGTVLTIENESGALVAYKTGKKWVNAN